MVQLVAGRKQLVAKADGESEEGLRDRGSDGEKWNGIVRSGWRSRILLMATCAATAACDGLLCPVGLGCEPLPATPEVAGVKDIVGPASLATMKTLMPEILKKIIGL